MKNLNIDDYNSIEELFEAIRINLTKKEIAQGKIKNIKNLYKYFDVDNISERTKSRISKLLGYSTFKSVRKHLNKYEIFKISILLMSESLAAKFCVKRFKTYGIIYPNKHEIEFKKGITKKCPKCKKESPHFEVSEIGCYSCTKNISIDLPNFIENGKVYLVKCPYCNLDNNSTVVASGICFWCNRNFQETYDISMKFLERY